MQHLIPGNKEFYKNKKVFITGHTGFKGAWLCAVLHYMGAEVCGYALAPEEACLFQKIEGHRLVRHVEGDVRDFEKLRNTLLDFQPEIVIHLAAQAIVNNCFRDPHLAYETNVMGTVNLFEAIRKCNSVMSVLIVTTDKVYENHGDSAIYKESDILGGIDPYSCSKTCMEHIAYSYRESYLREKNIGVATVRASNVLGGGDHMKNRLIPSILESLRTGQDIVIRNPGQTRPWQYVLDALDGYLTIAKRVYIEPDVYSEGWNIGPDIEGIRDVEWITAKMCEIYGEGHYRIEGNLQVKESATLGLDNSKAKENLNWKPQLNLDGTLRQIIKFMVDADALLPYENCRKQIVEFYK